MKKILNVILAIVEGLLTVVVTALAFILRILSGAMKVIVGIITIVVFLAMIGGVIRLFIMLPGPWKGIVFIIMLYGGALIFISALILLFWKPDKFFNILERQKLTKSKF